MTNIHINWSGCKDWHAARAKLRPLLSKATLYGNFTETDYSVDIIKQMEKNFKVTQEPFGKGWTLLRLSDKV